MLNKYSKIFLVTIFLVSYVIADHDQNIEKAVEAEKQPVDAVIYIAPVINNLPVSEILDVKSKVLSCADEIRNNSQSTKEYVDVSKGTNNGSIDNFGKDSLYQAVRENDEIKVHFLIRFQKINFTEVDANNKTALLLAVENGNFVICRLLLDSGAMPIKLNEVKNLFKIAARNQDEKIYNLLKEYVKEYAHVSNSISSICISEVIKNGNIVILKKLLDSIIVDDTNCLETICLGAFFAIESENIDMVEFLLNYDNSKYLDNIINYIDANCYNILHKAAIAGNYKITELIVNKIRSKDLRMLINLLESQDNTPNFWASGNKPRDLSKTSNIKRLLEDVLKNIKTK